MVLSVKTLVREPSAQNSLCLHETGGAAGPLLRTPAPISALHQTLPCAPERRSAPPSYAKGLPGSRGSLCSKHQTLTASIFWLFLDCVLVSQPDVKVLAGRNHICIFPPAPTLTPREELGIWGLRVIPGASAIKTSHLLNFKLMTW